MKPTTILAAFALGAMTAACATTPADAPAQAPATQTAAATPEIIIYHAESRRSERIVWLCEELGLPYDLRYRRGDVAGSFADIRAVNPGMAVAPTVFYNGELLMESGAIMQLLLDRHGDGKLVPAVDSPDYPAHLMWMHYAEGTLAADAVADYRVAQATDGLSPQPVNGREPAGQRGMNFANTFLETNDWFGGSDFSAADIMMVFPVAYATRMNVADMEQYPNVKEWLERVESRPAFKRMLASARPDGRISPPPALQPR